MINNRIDLFTRQRVLQKFEEQNKKEEVFNYVDKKTQTIESLLDKFSKALVMIYKVIPRSFPLPKIFNVKGTVSVDSMLSVNVKNLDDLEDYFISLEKRILNLVTAVNNVSKLTTEVTKMPQIDVKNLGELGVYFKTIETQLRGISSVLSQSPKKEVSEVDIKNIDELGKQLTTYFTTLDRNMITAIKSIQKESKVTIPKIDFPKIEIPKQDPRILQVLVEMLDEIRENKPLPIEIPRTISVDNFPPQMVPQPVTNISINPLRGVAETTAVTVTTSATALPTNPVANRRAIMLYNNSSQTVFLGGSDVTIATGLPITPGTFSPSIDAGPRMILYGIVSTGTSEVRAFEISNDAVGG